MRSPESVFEDLEADRASREAEMRLIDRLIQAAASANEQAMLERSLILLMYAHLEGFCKFSLLSYTSALNALGLTCAEASYPVAAATLHKVFAALRDPNSKHETFRNRMPDDTQLHLSAREQMFVESYERITAHKVDIPDQVVDTKSNLSPDVLKKLLFQLGLDCLSIEVHRSNISKLLGIRNAISHGDRLLIPSDQALSDYLATTLAIMAFMQGEIYSALSGRKYLKSA